MDFIERMLSDFGMHTDAIGYVSNIIMICYVILLSMIGNFIAKKIVLRVAEYFIKKNRFNWDDILLERKVFHKLSHIVPAIIISYFASSFPDYEHLIAKAVITYMIIVSLLVIDALLNTVDDIYRTYEISKSRPIKGFIQVIKIFIFIIGAVLVISTLIGESPLILLSGIGALSAVLMLIFKDSILGLVAGIQLSTNDMVRVGDWIEMPKYGADGDVIDISLNTVKVANWDKTITTVPSYALISDSFKNWRGMTDTGGRRIKRSIYIDMTSISFCSEELIEKAMNIHYLEDYIKEKQLEIEEYNRENQIKTSNKVNGRQLTNIGIFRIYIERYLKNHPKIHKELSLMVRQLAPSEHGLPLEIYAFTSDVRWVYYEGIQSDIFDHILAVAPEFGLRVFQEPTGHDFKMLKQS